MCVRLKENGWLIAKVVLVLFFLAIGPSMISDLRAEDAPPLWIAPLVLLGGFIMGLVSRFASRTPPWTERELWLANPFRYVFKFRDTEKVYYPPWIHLGLSPLLAGFGELAYSAFFRPEMIGLGAMISAIGTGWWTGIRLPDVLKFRKSEKRSHTAPERSH